MGFDAGGKGSNTGKAREDNWSRGTMRDGGYAGGKGARDDRGGRARDDKAWDEPRGRDDRGRDDRYNESRGEKGGKQDRYPDSKGERNDKGGKRGEKGGKKGEEGKGGKKGEEGKGKKGEEGKGGKKSRPEKIVAQGLRGKIIQYIKDKPSGFIKRSDGDRDVYFDTADIVDGATAELYDPVEFDVVEGYDQRLFAARIKVLPKDAPQEGPRMKSSAPTTASAAGSLTGSLTGKLTGKLTGGAGSLTGGGVSLRPGGLLGGGGLRPRGLLGTGTGFPKSEDKADEEPEDEEGQEGVEWARVVATRERFGFLQRLGGGDKGDIFFHASEVTGMNSNDPGDANREGIEVNLPHGRNSNGYLRFYLNLDDEVSYFMSKDHQGKPVASDIRKERKGAWRTGRRARDGPNKAMSKKDIMLDQMWRLTKMDADTVITNVSLLKDVLDSPEFGATQLVEIVSMLAGEELIADERADSLYRTFVESTTAQTSLRTSIIKHSSGKHAGSFLEECLRCIAEIVVRHSSPKDLCGRLPLTELVEAWEVAVQEGSSATKEGLSSEVKRNLQILSNKFPDEVKLDRVFKTKTQKVNRSAAEEYTELLEADHYQEMPILPTSAEMLGQCAFALQENMRTYEKCEDFLQTHFMLLREDYIEPLRAGIKLFMKGKHSTKDLHVYDGVKVVGMLSTWEGLVYRIELPKQQIRNINWEKSKQLMYGSLLCLSDDAFETLIWATVWRREADLMSQEGHLDIRLPVDTYDDRLSPGKTFCCIENVTIYFEAYRHVLVALQNMRPAHVPFQNTLMAPQPEPVPPGFLKAGSDMFNFHNVFHSCEKANSLVSAPKTFQVLQDWPSTLLESLDIDPSQLDAIKHALQHAVALIQGPPGTGKTWVGLKIVQALLDNTRTLRASPVLVVCYTNHALDQFLEGIFKFNEKIARIGSRSKSEVMQGRNLKDLVAEIQPSWEFKQAKRSLMERRDKLREELAKLLKRVDTHSLDVEAARDILSVKEFESFFKGYQDYLGSEAKRKLFKYEDHDAVDDELWEKMLKAFLDTSNPEKFAPVIAERRPGGPSKKTLKLLGDDDSSDDEAGKKKQEIANDADEPEEEEAEAEQHDRKLDIAPAPKTGNMDFHAELKYKWFPEWEEYVENTAYDLRTFNWRDEDKSNLWNLSLVKRRETYRQWLLESHFEAREQLPEIARLIERNAESRAALQRDRQLEVLRTMEVVGMTTTAVSKYQMLLKELRPEIVIVEEAAEVLEAHILTALHAQTQHVILIGDHQQLRPSTAVYRLSKNFNLDVSLFERLIKNGADHVTLQQQRRMHPKISRLIRPYYPELRDHMVTNQHPEIKGVDKRTYFLSHNNFEDDEGESHSKSNTFEANFIGALCAHLVKSGYEESQITVLSPYLGQVRTLKNKLRRDPNTSSVLVTAVDNYQGEENDIIVISLVRSNRNRSMGFVAVENRINVALTRAKHGMFIIGNADMLRGHPLWTKIISELQSDGSIGEDMPLLDPETGGIFKVKNADEISILIGDPSHHTGGEGENNSSGFDFRSGKGGGGGAAGRPVADRWAGLGKDDRQPKGKGKDKDKERWDGRGSYGSASSRANQRGGADRQADDYGDGRISMKDWQAGRAKGKATADEARQPVAENGPPPSKMQAQDGLAEGELVKRDDSEEAGDSDKKGGKKKQQKSGNKVMMRWG